ncbi:MAG: hypothetical protein ACI915_000019 [Gammaproteobacteria bacterium]|jgi:hypothetical protein
MLKRRNPLGNLPILGKGGAHVRTNAAKRAGNKRALGGDLDDWYEGIKEQRNEGLDGKAIEPFSFSRRLTRGSVSLSNLFS